MRLKYMEKVLANKILIWYIGDVYMIAINKIICFFKGHKTDFYVHDFGEQDGLYGERYKDTMYCKRCGNGDLRDW